MMLYQVRHTTRYEYQASVSLCHNLAHLLPRETPQQSCLASELQIDPLPNDLAERRDAFGNRTVYFAVEQPHQRQTVTMSCQVRVTGAPTLFAAGADTGWE